jgi:hypothetical protein
MSEKAKAEGRLGTVVSRSVEATWTAYSDPACISVSSDEDGDNGLLINLIVYGIRDTAYQDIAFSIAILCN